MGATTQRARSKGSLLQRWMRVQRQADASPERVSGVLRDGPRTATHPLPCSQGRWRSQVHSLRDKLYRPDVLERAWELVKRNKGSYGVDRQSIADIEAVGVAAFLAGVATELREGTYRVSPVRRVHIPKPGKPGKTRPLSIPTVKDRVVQQACRLVIEPIFEAQFLPNSFGFRPRRSARTPRWPSGD